MKRKFITAFFFVLIICISACENSSNEKYKQEQEKVEKQLDEERRNKLEEKAKLEKEIDSLRREKEKKAEELKKITDDN
jgi:septal ring factor EnvC (AmiA/AmiB activator)